MSGISTHILDTSRGLAAANVHVVLDKEIGGKWVVVSDARTDADGRVKNMLASGTPLVTATYRLTFDTGAYWKHAGVECFHPRVEVSFVVTDAGRHCHVPLLVSPFGYTTYRGT